jgi:hypothetical protein
MTLYALLGILVLPIFGAELLIEQGGIGAAAGGLIVVAYGAALSLFFWVATSK